MSLELILKYLLNNKIIFSMKTLRTPVEDDAKKIECTHEGKHKVK